MRIVHAYHRRKTAVDWHFSTKKWPNPIWILDANTRHLNKHTHKKSTYDHQTRDKILSTDAKIAHANQSTHESSPNLNLNPN